MISFSIIKGMIYTTELEHFPGFRFNIDARVTPQPSVEPEAMRAIALVWRKYFNRPEAFNVIFASRLVAPGTDIDTGLSAQYDPDSDELRFALDTMMERFQLGLPMHHTMIITAAHETKHKVQFALGQNPTHHLSFTSPENYFDDPHEVDATNEALDLFKGIFPNASGGFNWGHRRFEIPTQSTYKDIPRF